MNIVIDENSIEILKEIKNQNLESIEYAVSKIHKEDESYMTSFGIIRLNINGKHIDLYNETSNKDSDEEPAYFNLKETTEPFKTFSNGDIIKALEINDYIKSINIINDKITLPNNKIINIDNAIIINTNHNIYTISKDTWFMETMTIDINKSIDDIISTDEIKEQWDFDEVDKVYIDRNIIKI